MNNSRFIELVNLYLQDRMTEREGRELAELLHRPEYQKELETHLLDQLKNGEFDLESPPATVHGRIQASLELQIGSGVRDRGVTAQVHRVHFIRRSFWRYAAAVVLVAVGGLYLYQRLSAPALLSQERRFKNDLQPGSRRATLTLADGSRVAMTDSTAALRAGDAKGELHIATGKGETYSLVLPDGSRVWLNASSSLRYPVRFSGGRRHVELDGEAYFEVQHDAKDPFSVGLPDGSMIKDLGTRFNVHAYRDENAVRTTVLEGAVQVEAKGHELSLVPGEQAEYSAHEDLRRNQRPDLKNVVAWKEERFSLDATSIQEIMKQVERWYGAEVIYQDDMQDDTTEFFGSLTRNIPVSELLKTLEATGHVHFIIEGKKITVMK